MKHYFAYVRVSTTRQNEQGTSPQEQRHAIEGYALRQGLKISQWYQESESAAKGSRPQFTRMLKDLRRSRASGIVMHRIDRGARNLRDWAVLLDLVDTGCDVHFVHDSVDLTSRGGRLTANIQAVMAADYSRNLSDEVKKGQLGRLRQGFYPFAAPIGYLNGGKAKPKMIDPVRGPLVRQAFELYATGRYGLDTLRRELCALGLRRADGSALSRGSMATLLHNPFYVGLMSVPAAGEIFTGNHEPLVSRELFNSVQQMFAGKVGAKIQKHYFVFRRRVRCAVCGRALIGEHQKGRAYYRCQATSCRGTSLREDALHDAVREELSWLRLDERELGDVREVLGELVDEDRRGVRDRVRELTIKIAKLDERVSRLTDLLMDGTVDRASYVAKKEELLLARADLADAVRRADNAPFWRDVREKLELGFDAYLRYDSENPTYRRGIVDQVISNFTVRTKRPEITLRFPYAEWVEWAKSSKCAPAQARPRTQSSFRDFLSSLNCDGSDK